MDGETWEPVVGWERFYGISNAGRVWSNARWVPSCWGPESIWKPGSILIPGTNPAGRLKVTLSAGGRRQDAQIHVLVAEAFLGPRPAGLDCCHNDGDLTNNHASNLRWDTVGSNILDEVRHGTHRNSRKTHCSLDHPLADPNLYRAITPKGSKTSRCKACSQAKALLRQTKGRTSFPPGDAQLKALADVKCEVIMPDWRNWVPPEGFTRSAAG